MAPLQFKGWTGEEPVRAARLSQAPSLGTPSLPTATDGRDTGSKGPEEPETPEVPGVDQAATQTHPKGTQETAFPAPPARASNSLEFCSGLSTLERLREMSLGRC